MKNLFLISLLFIQYNVFSQNWQLVWEDNFDNQNVFEARWKVLNLAEYDDINIFLASNVNLVSGNLEIQTKYEAPFYYCQLNDPNTVSFGYNKADGYYPVSSGMVALKETSNVQFGLIRAKIRIPGKVSGYWPAFWTFIGDGVINAANAAEIDICEMAPEQNSFEFSTNFHRHYAHELSWGNGNSGIDPSPDARQNHGPFGYDMSDWHIYSVEWGPNIIKWYMDGFLMRQEFNHGIIDPVKLILGGGWSKSWSTYWLINNPLTMQVAYVEYYKEICGSNPTISSPFGNLPYNNKNVIGDNITYNGNAVAMTDDATAIASNSIVLMPGFYTNGKSFSALINPNLCNSLRVGAPNDIYENDRDEEENSVIVNELSKPLVTIYPNPNNGQFTINLKNNNNTTTLIEIYDLMGKKVISENNTSNKITINISTQPKGIYLVRVSNGDVVFTEKIVYQ